MPQNTMNIVAVQENHLLISLNGTLHRINKDFETLRQFVLQSNQAQISAADNIYNIGSINEASFNIITNSLKLPRRLSTYLPQLNKSQIVGRGEDLGCLHDLLAEQKAMVIVNSIGGLGKTTLLQAYVGTYYHYYQHLLWVTQNEHQSLSNAFINTKGLMMNLGIDAANTNPASWFDMILNKLHSIADQPCLLVIDNAHQDLVSYSHAIPRPPNWHILISSREHIEGYTSYQLEQLSPSEALQLFNRYYLRNSISQADRQKLLEMVEYHTLTIELLAKTAQVMHLNAEQLFRALHEDAITNIVTDHQSNKTQHIGRIMSYLASIFDLSNLNPSELYLLQQFACLPSIYVPYSKLQQLFCSNNNPINDQLPMLLETVRNKGWLYSDTKTDTYHMHVVVAQILQQKQNIKPETVTILIDNVAKQLNLDQNKDNPIDKFVWIPYGERLVKLFDDSEMVAVSHLQNNLALILREKGDYLQAQMWLQKAISSSEKHFGTEHPTTAIRYGNLALVLKGLGKYQAAKELLQKTIAIGEKKWGTGHPNTAGNYANLALVLKNLGEYETAKELLQKALAIDEKELGEEHPTTTTIYSNLATVLKCLGEYETSKELLEKAVLSDEKNFGVDHPRTAIRYSNLAISLQDLGEYQTAKELLQKAVLASEKHFGTEHPTTAVRYSNLATILQDLGEYEAAKELLQKAIVASEKTFGTEHSTTTARYSNLALVLKDLGEYEAAKELLQKAVLCDERNLGKEHPTTVKRYTNLALVLKELGEYETAKDLLQKATESNEKKLGKEHPITTQSYTNLAMVLKNLGKYEAAKVLLQRAVLSNEKKLGKEHPITTQSYTNLAMVLQESGYYQNAKLLLQKVILSNEKKLGPKHPVTKQSYANLALVLKALSKYHATKMTQQFVPYFCTISDI